MSVTRLKAEQVKELAGLVVNEILIGEGNKTIILCMQDKNGFWGDVEFSCTKELIKSLKNAGWEN